MTIKSKDKNSKPGFGIVCPKCNRNNCMINVKGEPIAKNSKKMKLIEVKIYLNIVCNDCKYCCDYTT